MMRKIFAPIALLILSSSTATFAADLRLKAPPPVVGPYAYNWTGWYVGGHLGYLWGTASNDAGLPTGFASGAFLGLQGGYRYQYANNLVLGVQVSAPVWAQDQTRTILNTFHDTVKFKGTVLLQGQLGFAIGPWMPFATAGIGLGRVSAQENTSLVVTNTHGLFTAGLGVNYALSQQLTTGARWNHLWTTADNYNCGPVFCPLPGNFWLTADTFTGVVEYRF